MKVSSIISSLYKRRWVLLLLCIVVPAGFSFKAYGGPGCKWFNDYGAAVMYEIFWCLVVFLFIPRKKHAATIAITVFTLTSVLEVLQLWRPWLLQRIRATFLGQALIGTTFVLWDFPHYLLGCFIAWRCMRALAPSDGGAIAKPGPQKKGGRNDYALRP